MPPFRKQCSLYAVTYCLGFHFQFRGKLNSLAIALSVYPGNFISTSFLFAICPLGKILQVHEVVSAFQRAWGFSLFLPAGQYLNNSWPKVFCILRSTGKEGGGEALWEHSSLILGFCLHEPHHFKLFLLFPCWAHRDCLELTVSAWAYETFLFF